MLGEFVESTRYTRKYAIHLLNSWGRTSVVRGTHRRTDSIARRRTPLAREAPHAPRRYDQDVLNALRQILVRVRHS